MAAATEVRRRAEAVLRETEARARELRRGLGVESDAERKRRTRAADRDIRIPELSAEDRAERLRREADDALWLQSYWAAFSTDEFYPPSPQQLQMVADFRAALEHGGDRSTAASRGEGKTTFAVALLLKEILRGNVRFGILLGATATNAGNMLEKITLALSESAELRQYYPEVCVPVAALEYTAQRAGKQTVSGFRHDDGSPFEMARTAFHWAGNKLVFPNVPGSPSAGAIVIAQGLDSAIRGLNVRNMRPDIVLIDDPDTDDTANSQEQAGKLLKKIDRGIAALGSQKRPVTRLALVTVASTCSVAAQLTDRKLYPSFRGRRFRFLLKPPTAAALWSEFVTLCRDGWTGSEDQDAPPIPLAAHRFYLERRADMDAGAEVSNPNRYDHRERPEGGTVETSALEHYFGWVARIGQESTSTEFDNDPPDPQEQEADGLSPHRIQHQVSGYARGVVPPGCVLLTMGIDVGKYMLHWVVIAWKPDGTSYVIDYEITKVHGTTAGTDEGLEAGLSAALRTVIQQRRDEPYCTPDGTPHQIGLTLIDEGWGLTTTVVRRVCGEVGQIIQIGNSQEPNVQPAKGRGDGAKREQGGRLAPMFTQFLRRDWDHRPGDNWCRSRVLLANTVPEQRVWIYHHNAGTWKDWGIRRWLTHGDRAGCRFVFGLHQEAPRVHMLTHADLSKQLCANCYRPEIVAGKQVIKWGERPGMKGTKDHYQDAQELADVAASILGLRVADEPEQQPQAVGAEATPERPAAPPRAQVKPSAPREFTMAELAAKARGA